MENWSMVGPNFSAGANFFANQNFRDRTIDTITTNRYGDLLSHLMFLTFQ